MKGGIETRAEEFSLWGDRRRWFGKTSAPINPVRDACWSAAPLTVLAIGSFIYGVLRGKPLSIPSIFALLLGIQAFINPAYDLLTGGRAKEQRVEPGSALERLHRCRTGGWLYLASAFILALTGGELAPPLVLILAVMAMAFLLRVRRIHRRLTETSSASF